MKIVKNWKYGITMLVAASVLAGVGAVDGARLSGGGGCCPLVPHSRENAHRWVCLFNLFTQKQSKDRRHRSISFPRAPLDLRSFRFSDSRILSLHSLPHRIERYRPPRIPPLFQTSPNRRPELAISTVFPPKPPTRPSSDTISAEIESSERSGALHNFLKVRISSLLAYTHTANRGLCMRRLLESVFFSVCLHVEM